MEILYHTRSRWTMANLRKPPKNRRFHEFGTDRADLADGLAALFAALRGQERCEKNDAPSPAYALASASSSA